MGITEPNWDEIQNLHLQSLESKATGKRWNHVLQFPKGDTM